MSFFRAALRASAPFIVAILVMAALGAAVITADAALTAHNLFVNQTAPAQMWLGRVDWSQYQIASRAFGSAQSHQVGDQVFDLPHFKL